MLQQAGISCYVDTIEGLLGCGAIEEVEGTFVLSAPAAKIFQTFTVALSKSYGTEMWVDYPLVLAIMPFSAEWSHRVYEEMIKPAAKGAGLACVRADENIQIGDIREALWDLILEAGYVVAEVSEPNPNVFYELGLSHAMGKESLLIKRKDTQVPADFAGSLYYQYDIDNLEAGKLMLQKELQNWARRNKADGVKALRGPSDHDSLFNES
jgi:hypothetical protein